MLPDRKRSIEVPFMLRLDCYSSLLVHWNKSIRIMTFVILAAALVVAPGCTKKPEVSAGIDLAGMDTSVAAGDDFNAYTNGGWIKATPIPADKSSYGAGAILVDDVRKRTQALIQETANTISVASEDAAFASKAI